MCCLPSRVWYQYCPCYCVKYFLHQVLEIVTPVTYGEMVEKAPFSPRATPISPAKGRIGILICFSSSNQAYPSCVFRLHILICGSGNSSASRPNPGIRAVQPHSAVSTERTSTWRTSPGSAPSTYTGPFTWSSSAKIKDLMHSTVESSLICPFDASKQSKATSSPDAIRITGGILR